jgi:hypothetical protein
MTVYALTIAQPHTRYDELAEIAWRRTESVCGSEDRAKPQQIVTRAPNRSPDHIEQNCRPKLLRLLERRGELSTFDLTRLLHLRRAQVSNLLNRARRARLVVGRRNPDQSKHGKGSAVHEYLWRIA